MLDGMPDPLPSAPSTSTHLGAARPVLVRSEGCWVWDRDGRRYLDATSGAFCVNLGYTRPDLIHAMTAAAARLPHARPSTFDSEEAEGYRAELLAAVGPPFIRVLLTSSGSEAVEVAMKIAIAWQRAAGGAAARSGTAGAAGAGRTTVRSLAGHYHGATLGALGVTGWEERRAPWAGAVGPRAEGLPAPGDGSAALIAETIPVAGLGVAVPPPGAIAARRAACDAAGALWIADEVLTGFGRCGALFAWRRLAEREDAAGARPDASAIPDLVVFGKGAGAGFAALAGVMVSERVAAAFEPGAAPFPGHHQSYGGNPIACAVGRVVLRALAAESIDERARGGEESVARTLERAAGGAGARGIGAHWAVSPALSDAPAAGAARLHAALRERGVLTHLATAGAGAIVIAPPLTMEGKAWETIGAAVEAAAGEAAG
jgi:adenosylmethionine-8-amino-7-oxononanoate aminotransferase